MTDSELAKEPSACPSTTIPTTVSTKDLGRYTIERHWSFFWQQDIVQFLIDHADKLNSLFDNTYDPSNFKFAQYAFENRFMVARRDGIIVGIHLSRLTESVFDPSKTIARQDLLYALPSTRASYYLMADFIDFGRRNANHIIAVLSRATNIKPRSMEKLGFKELETAYRLDV